MLGFWSLSFKAEFEEKILGNISTLDLESFAILPSSLSNGEKKDLHKFVVILFAMDQKALLQDGLSATLVAVLRINSFTDL